MSSLYIKPDAITDAEERGMAKAFAAVLKMHILHQQEIAEQVMQAKKALSFKKAHTGEEIMGVIQQHIEMVRAELMLIIKKYPDAMAVGPQQEVVA